MLEWLRKVLAGIASLKEAPTEWWVDSKGWLRCPEGEGVFKKMKAHPSWHYSYLTTPTGEPIAIMAHYTATRPNTAMNMARRRLVRREEGDRAASWHVTIEEDGSVVQMISLKSGAWHCSKGKVAGVPINRSTVGIELVGYGKKFTDAQVFAAQKVWRAIVRWASIERGNAMLEHSKFDPERRSDPGPVWMERFAPVVLDYAYEPLASPPAKVED